MQIFVLEQSKLFLTRTHMIVFEQAHTTLCIDWGIVEGTSRKRVPPRRYSLATRYIHN